MQVTYVRITGYRICLFWAALFLSAVAVSAEEPVVPLPEPNPKRQPQTTTDASPPAEAPPPLPGDRPTVAWKDPKIRDARGACAEMLAGLDIDYEQLDPIKKGLCGAPAPIRVKSIGKDPAVVISPPATMTCKLARALHAWFKDTVQPSASDLGTSVVKIRNASSYKCRNRYGQADTKISEHALANALDISEFVFASGQRIKLLGNWPYGALAALPLKPDAPTPNPRREETLSPGTEGIPANDVTQDESSLGQTLAIVARARTNPFVRPDIAARATDTQSPASTRIAAVKSNPFVNPPPEATTLPNLPTSQDVPEDERTSGPRTIDEDEAKAFLKLLHTQACKTFETVLGPDANAAHKDHFHLDMKKRRYVKICE